MASMQGKRFRFSGVPEAPQARTLVVPPTRTTGKIKRNLALGLTVAAPLIAFSIFHPMNDSVNPISSATAAAAVEAESLTAERTSLVTANSKIKGLSRLEATLDAASGEMRELYGVGSLAGTEATLRLDLRSRAIDGKKAGFFAALADSTDKMGAMVRKLGADQTMATSRGPLEWAEMTLAASTGPKTCLAFRLSPSDDKRLNGFLCGPNGMKPDVALLPCVVERLELTPGAMANGFSSLLRGPTVARPACHASVI